MGAGIAQPGQDGLRHCHLRLQSAAVVGRLLVSQQHPDLAGALGDGRQPQLDAEAGGVPDGDRQHPRRHAVRRVGAPAQPRGTAKLVDRGLAGGLAVNQQRGVAAAGSAVGVEHGADALALVDRPGVGEGHRAARANGAAGATADAQVRLDEHAAALRRNRHRTGPGPASGLALQLALERGLAADRLRRTDIDAGGAADLLIATVGAELGLVAEKARLLELADQVAQGDHGLHQFGRVAARVKVALRRLMLGEGRLGAQIQHQVKALLHRLRRALEVDCASGVTDLDAIAVRLATRQVDLVVQVDRALGAGLDTGVAAGAQVQVDRIGRCPFGLEGADPAAQPGQFAGMHGMAVDLAQRAAGAGDEQAQVQLVGQHRRRRLGGARRADHQAAAGRGIADGGHRRGIRQLGLGDQRGDLRHGCRGVARPAAGLADVDEVDRSLLDRSRADGLGVEVEEQPRLLRAGHQQRLGGERRGLGRTLEGARFAPAQQAVNRLQPVAVSARGLVQRLAQRRRVQGHRAVAVADQRFHGWRAIRRQAFGPTLR